VFLTLGSDDDIQIEWKRKNIGCSGNYGRIWDNTTMERGIGAVILCHEEGGLNGKSVRIRSKVR
jgi:hypothetical protein